MRRTFARLSALIVAATVAAGGVPAAQAAEPSGAVVQATCYGGAYTYPKGRNQQWLPSAAPTVHFVTGTSCADINLKSTQIEVVKVCFVRTGCQSGWKITRPNEWFPVATNVRDNVDYYFQFSNSPASTVQVAD
jgi:hypothetical protein